MSDKTSSAIILEKQLGDLRQWLFTGHIIYNDEHDGMEELPRCVCGHTITYSHEIQMIGSNVTAYVGSECIGNFSRKSRKGARYTSLEKLRKEAKEYAAYLKE